MATRITDANLRAVVDRINRMTGSPMNPWESTQPISERIVAQIGNFHLSHAYGGVSLCRMSNEAGGVNEIFGRGHMPKRELYELMQAFIRGLDFDARR